jgi:cell division protein FtsN
VPKDYKNTPRPKTRRGASKKKNTPKLPGWVWISGILALGVVIGLYAPGLLGIVKHRYHQIAPAISTPSHPAAADSSATADKSDTSETHFDFYTLLPKFQVVIPDEDKTVKSDTGKQPVKKPGAYVLQVASFRHYRDADAMKARLALLGLESHIQQVHIADGETWNRVRIGPINNLGKLNDTRKTLASHKIKPLLIRVKK